MQYCRTHIAGASAPPPVCAIGDRMSQPSRRPDPARPSCGTTGLRATCGRLANKSPPDPIRSASTYGSYWRRWCCWWPPAVERLGKRLLVHHDPQQSEGQPVEDCVLSGQTLSAILGTAKKPNCRRHSRVRLGGSRAERYGKSLSEYRFVSEAWGLADLLYKLFSLTFQCPSLIAQPEGWYPFAFHPARSKVPNPLPSASGRMTGRPPAIRARHTPAHGEYSCPVAMPSPAMQTDPELLAGIVERVTFHRVKARGHRDLATIVGQSTISPGECNAKTGFCVLRG